MAISANPQSDLGKSPVLVHSAEWRILAYQCWYDRGIGGAGVLMLLRGGRKLLWWRRLVDCQSEERGGANQGAQRSA